MWDHKRLLQMDFRFVPLILFLMGISLLVISSMTSSSYVQNQIQWFLVGWAAYLFFAGIDYHLLAKWSWVLYGLMLLILLGLYLTSPIQAVHRWYRLPLGFLLQPSEFAKLVVVIAISAFLEKKGREAKTLRATFHLMFLVGLPFLLILKQPDLGTALVLYPIMLGICFFGRIHRGVFRLLFFLGIGSLILVALFFTHALSHEAMRPYCTKLLKGYQFERLNPDTYHQKAAQIAIAIGGLSGAGWQKGEFSRYKYLPAAHTDSVFAAFAEEFGFLGIAVLLFLFYLLIELSFQVVAVAKDPFGCFLASGIAVYLAMHMIVNSAMMCGFLPIAGVPLVLISYGGSSVVATMVAFGILQSIYTRRFLF